MDKQLDSLIQKHFGESKFDKNTEEFIGEINSLLAFHKEKSKEINKIKCAFLENLPFQGWIKDLDSKFIVANQLFSSAYNKTPEELIGKTDYDLCSEELAKKYVIEDKEVIRSKKAIYDIKKKTDNNGKTIWIESYKKPFFDSHNNVLGTTGYARNITDQKNAEENIAKSEQRFKDIVANIHDGITIIENKQIIFCNDRISAITGYSAEEFMKLTLDDLIEDKDKERINNLIKTAKSKNQKLKELGFWIHRKDGGKKFVHNRYTFFEKNGVKGRYIITTDLTEKKIAQDNLRNREKMFRGFFELPLTGIAICNPNLEWIEVNDKLCKILGYTKDEFKKITWDDLTPEEDKEFHERRLFKKVASGEMDGTTIEKRYIKKNGSFIHAFICSSCIRDEDGNIEYFFSMIDDITYKVQIEDQLEMLMKRLENWNKELEQKVKEEVKKNREKDFMLAQQSKHAALGEMIGNIAHQWRQPLNAVGLIIQDLEDAYEFGELDESYLKNKVSKSMELIEFMSQTIDDFRQFFRLDKMKQEFNVKDVVQKAISFVEASFNNLNIKITVEILEDALVRGYPNEYAQVILNLLNNARDVLLERKPEYPEIVIKCQEKDSKSLLEIIDNGKGIPEDKIDKIFEPYYTTKEASKGTGLGLYMSKTIIETNMEGKIIAANHKDGAIFSIIL